MDDLSGKTALITGAGGGIGRTLVSTFVGRGCRVIACDQDAGALTGLEGIAGTATFDLLDPASIANAAGSIEQKFGAPDCLVNNAGWTRAETMDDITDAVIEKELALNLSGVMRLTQALLPGMAKRGGGIVFVTSVNAIRHFGNPVYAAAKSGIEAYSRAIAVEQGVFGIRSNTVAPGSTRTPAWDHRLQRDPALAEKVGKLYPLRRMVSPQEVANAVAFLASPAAGGITGVTLPVDAGATAGYLPFIDTVLKGGA